MATNRPKGFGMSADIAKKQAAKFDAGRANEAFEWMKAILEHADASGNAEDIALLQEVHEPNDIQKPLKDGRIICKVINIMYPGCVKKINKVDSGHFKISKDQENIANFLKACEDQAKCHKGDLFQTVGLYEAENLPSVIDTLFSLGRKVHHHADTSLPALGSKEADENKREFTEEQLKDGQNVIGLQMGSNKGASQAGQNFGKTRSVLD